MSNMVKLKDIGKVITGKTPKTNIKEYWNSNDIPFVKPTDFINKITVLNKYKTYISNDGYQKTNRVPKNSVLVTCIGTIGKIATNDIDVATNQQINSIVPNEKINYKYLMFQMLEKKEYLNHIANAPVVPIINKTTFENIEINLPTLTKQKEIASVLDKAQELISLRTETIKKLDELSKSIFINMFGDPISNTKKYKQIKLSLLGKWTSGGTPHRANQNYFKGNLNWFTAGELNTLYVSKSKERITKVAIKESSAKLFKINTLLVGMYDTAAFKMSILKTESSTNQAIANLDYDDSKYNVLWIYYAFLLKKETYLNERRGVRQQNLSLTKIKNFFIINPKYSEQNKFAKIIEKIEEQKSLYEEELNKLEENFKALLQKSFN